MSNFLGKKASQLYIYIYKKMLMEMSRRILFYCFYIYYTFIWIQLIEFSKRKLNCLFVHFNRFIIRIEVKEQFWMRIEGVWWCGDFFLLMRDCLFFDYLFSSCWWFKLMGILFKLNKNWWTIVSEKILSFFHVRCLTQFYQIFSLFQRFTWFRFKKKSIKIN